MAVINQFMVEVLDAVDRQLRVRQDQTSAVSQIPPNPNAPSDPATPSSSSNTPSNQPSGGPTSSPLLFFVALGFGVVFTNLWIIVGVKYCFRYNARNRALRNGDDIDPIGLDHMQARPHRRRREKKLMTMDEVNERFPLMKYKTWVASRAREGLPTSGGVSVPPSRAQSIRDVEVSILSSPTETIDSLGCQHPKPVISTKEKTEVKKQRLVLDTDHLDHEDIRISEKDALSPNGDDSDHKEKHSSFEEHDNPSENPASNSSDEEDEDHHMNTVIPSELLASPGDSCAICIDTLEEEDEIRGLSCGHAFHAGCLDPWLTSRRACCPLCKADYHIPKSRPEGDNLESERIGRRRPDRSNLPLYSQSLWSSIFSNPRAAVPNHSHQTIERAGRSSWRPPGPTTAQASGAISDPNSSSQPTRSLNIPFFTIPVRSLHLHSTRTLRRNREAPAATAAEPNPNSHASLSQLEAGTINR